MLKITKRPDSPYYQIVGKCPYTKERKRESTGTSNKDQAEAVLTQYLEKQKRIVIHGPQSVSTFADAVEEYLAKGGEARFLEKPLRYLGTMRLSEINDQDISRGATAHYPTASMATIRRQWYTPIQAVWSAASNASMTHEKRWQKPKFKQAPVKPGSDEDLDLVLRAMTTLNQRCMLLFMSFSAARRSEVVRVRVRDHDASAGTVLLSNTKNNDARVVHLPAFVNEALKLLPHNKPDTRLFGYSSIHSINKAVTRACKRAGIPHTSPHKLGRHAFAARFLRDGHTLRDLMHGGGWKSVTAVMRYAHLEKSHVDRSVRGVTTTLDTPETQTLFVPYINTD